MTSYGYIIMIIVDLISFWLHHAVDEVISYIATNVCSWKSATIFGDLPDW